MRKIFMIRHGETDYGGKCIGKMETHINQTGKKSALMLRKVFIRNHYNVYASPLERAKETAYLLFGKEQVNILEGLSEISVGEWENMSFKEIKQKWPTAYKKRGEQPYRYRIPKGQSLEDAGITMSRSIHHILEKEEGDVVLVTHAGAIKGFLCKEQLLREEQLFTTNIPNCSISVVKEENGKFQLELLGVRPYKTMTDEVIQNLYEEYELPLTVRAHMEAVADYAMHLGGELNRRNVKIDLELVKKAALVHDIVRSRKNHAIEGARILRKKGYLEIAQIVEKHHDLSLQEGTHINEKSLLYYADKRISGAEKVSIEERFSISRKKCHTQEALESFNRRYEVAAAVERQIKKVLEG